MRSLSGCSKISTSSCADGTACGAGCPASLIRLLCLTALPPVNRWLARAPLRASGSELLELAQRTDVLAVLAPALHRSLVHLLPHLPGARGRHGALGFVEVEAALVPVQT